MGEQESKRYGTDRLRSQVPRRDRHSPSQHPEKTLSSPSFLPSLQLSLPPMQSQLSYWPANSNGQLLGKLRWWIAISRGFPYRWIRASILCHWDSIGRIYCGHIYPPLWILKKARHTMSRIPSVQGAWFIVSKTFPLIRQTGILPFSVISFSCINGSFIPKKTWEASPYY